MTEKNPRRLAWAVLRRIHEDDAYSHIALSAALDEAELSDLDRGLATELVYGVLTWRRALDTLLDDALRKGLQSIDDSLVEVLRIAVYQMRFLDRVPDHAIIDEAVEHAREIEPRTTGLVNGVLREMARNRDTIWWRPGDAERKVARYIGARWSLPNWLANRLQQRFGRDRGEALAEAFSTRPPIWLRRTDVRGLEAAIRSNTLDSKARTLIDDGKAVVQDLGSQLVGLYAAPGSEDRVLDACAGVGGKTLHLAQVAASVLACDPQQSKLEMMTDSAGRVGVADQIEARAVRVEELPDEQYDGVLLDAPCTGLGVLRRHPETRWRRRQADITTLANLQRDLLDESAKRVRPGGWLTYSVCTWTREETTKQVEQFLERHPDFERSESAESLAKYLDESGNLAVYPDSDDCDAFFAARFVRR